MTFFDIAAPHAGVPANMKIFAWLHNISPYRRKCSLTTVAGFVNVDRLNILHAHLVFTLSMKHHENNAPTLSMMSIADDTHCQVLAMLRHYI